MPEAFLHHVGINCGSEAEADQTAGQDAVRHL